jgi:hypothetical protein
MSRSSFFGFALISLLQPAKLTSAEERKRISAPPIRPRIRRK